MPGHHRVDRVAPVIPNLVQIAMANARVEDFNPDIAWSQRAAFDAERAERIRGAPGGIGRRGVGVCRGGVCSRGCRVHVAP